MPPNIALALNPFGTTGFSIGSATSVTVTVLPELKNEVAPSTLIALSCTMYIPGSAVNVCVPAVLNDPAGFVPSPNDVPAIFCIGLLLASLPFHVTEINPAPPTTSPESRSGSLGTVEPGVVML